MDLRIEMTGSVSPACTRWKDCWVVAPAPIVNLWPTKILLIFDTVLRLARELTVVLFALAMLHSVSPRFTT
jgi:hypothetical protein